MSDKSNRFSNLEFCSRFKQMLKETDEKALAEHLGIQSTSTFRQWSNGYTLPTCENLLKLSEFSGKSTDWLLGLTDAEDGNADVVAVERRLGLHPDVQEIRKAMLEYSPDPVRYGLSFVDALLSSKNFGNLCYEIYYYCKSAEQRSSYEKEYNDIDLTVKWSADPIYINADGDTEAEKEENARVKTAHENEIRKAYYAIKREERFRHFEAHEYFASFLSAFGEAISNGFDPVTYFSKYVREADNNANT